MEWVPSSTPSWVDQILPSVLWRFATKEPIIYLTFDDGPIPEVTPWVLDLLAKNNAKATFFCIGANVKKYPEIYQRILDEGHTVGNHTHNHLNGWKTGNKEYFTNIKECGKWVETTLFRPPYGKLSQSQLKQLKKKYQIVMWSVLSKDYDAEVRPESCLGNVLTSRPGDILVFHDSLKAEENLRYTLPRLLKHHSNMGMKFCAIPQTSK